MTRPACVVLALADAALALERERRGLELRSALGGRSERLVRDLQCASGQRRAMARAGWLPDNDLTAELRGSTGPRSQAWRRGSEMTVTGESIQYR